MRGLHWPPSTNQKPGSSDPRQWIPSLSSQAQSVCKFCAKRKLHQGAWWQTTIAEMCYDYIGSRSDLIFYSFSVFLVVYCVYCIFSPNLDWIIQILVLDLIRSARHYTGPRRYKGKLTNNKWYSIIMKPNNSLLCVPLEIKISAYIGVYLRNSV